VPNLDRLSVEDLRRRLADGLRDTAGKLLELAAIVVELEARGEDLAGMRTGLVRHLRAIGSGTLLPDLVVRYAGRERLLERIAALPIAEQQRLVADNSVVVVIDGESRQIDPLALPWHSIDQVFAGDRVRTAEEQSLYIATKKAPKKKQPKPAADRVLKAHPDHDRGGITVGKAFVPKAEIVFVLAELAGPLESVEPHDPGVEVASLHLTGAEKNRLRLLAKSSGTTESQLIRQALRACGLI
jgi:hypothetical protein